MLRPTFKLSFFNAASRFRNVSRSFLQYSKRGGHFPSKPQNFLPKHGLNNSDFYAEDRKLRDCPSSSSGRLANVCLSLRPAKNILLARLEILPYPNQSTLKQRKPFLCVFQES